MIRLKNILINNSSVKCDIFPEDSKENGNGLEFEQTEYTQKYLGA